MTIGLSEEHRALHEAVRRWADDRCPAAVPRSWYGDGERRAVHADVADQGWLGLHLPESHGGAGYGLVEAACVLEELGRAVAPGALLPTVLASTLLARGGADPAVCERLATGAAGAVTLTPVVEAEATDGGGWRLSGTVDPVLGLPEAELLVVGAVGADGEVWALVDAADTTVEPLAAVDPTRPLGRLELDGVEVPAERVLDGVTAEDVLAYARALLAAEAAGVAGWCVDTAADYAKVREQFGRPIGQFQAVKHRCSDMLVRLEQVRALAWDAARAMDDPEDRETARMAAALAGGLAPEAAWRNAEDCIQVLGGIGFTWEHDAHVYLKRATAVRQLTEAPVAGRADAARSALAGHRRRLHVDLPPEAESLREQIRPIVDEIAEVEDRDQRRVALADHGLLAPHLPEPWGRDAGAVEQLVIEQELRRAKVRQPHLQVAAWVVPTLVAYGTPEQQERWLPPTLRGEISWCQLFSEPGAGSDLASLTTKAVRDANAGGWRLTGQKVWTSMAQDADYGICLARTDPDAPKHDGITYFLVEMDQEGVDVRPLRELTGESWFNEVFLSDAFVPDEQVVGPVDGGWEVARNTLANERVVMGSGSSFGGSLEQALQQLPEDAGEDTRALDEVGALLCDGASVALLGLRTTLQQLSGVEPGSASSVRKLLGVEHDQRVSEFALSLLGPAGAVAEGAGAQLAQAFLFNRCLTIAGGTSEVQRNVIAERLLGLPRD